MCRRFKILKQLIYLSFLLLSACEGTTANTLSTEKTIKPIQVETPSNPVIEKDLWRYIANRYTLSAPDQKKLFWHIDWFKKNPDYLTRVTKRAKPYLYLVTKEVEKAGLPIEIALLPIVESAYYPFSYSHGTASGLWQFIPSTGRLYGLKETWWYDGRRDVLASTKAAVKYLKNLNKLFKGDWLLAIAAYNSGPGRVQKAVRKNKKLGKKADFWHLDLPSETKGYVPRLLAVAELIKSPSLYNQSVTSIDNQPQVRSVVLNSQFDLALISQWTDLSLDELYSLNPGLKRWATPSTGPYTMLLPVDAIEKFEENLSIHPKEGRVRWLRHKIKAGDSLSYLSHKFKTTVDQIKSVNNLNSNVIKVGEYLIVPIAQKSENYYSLSEDQREKRRINAKKNGFKVIHTVKSGDSLWKISNKYDTPIKSIIKWNHLSRTEPLKIGKKLVIWRSSITKPDDLSKVVNTGIDISRKVTYRVRNGDNLSKIASKFKVSVSDLKSWNKLDDKKPLQIGQKLKIIVNVINSKMK
ncbi:MAG TPA: LysM peptidoglycan-binding domain-containing protein [Candidatus Thioglobus sp.]|jgi:membrane-bound lytic murein transglycosylase D|nr:LysM peptidoglycan-binding domain-containing protein [Candidatus Thioglobus sp.]